MAYNFFAGKMASQQLDSALTNAVVAEDIKDGALLVLGELATDDTYAADGKEYDVYEATAPEAATDEVVIVDYAGVSNATNGELIYKMGVKLVDLTIPAKEPTRVRRLHLHDKFWLGADNFSAAPTVGKYATAEAGKYTHKPADAIAEGQYCVKILVAKQMTVGMSTKGLQYLCEVVEL